MPLSRLTAELPTLEVRSHDAVVVVPGIMGSELVEKATQRTLWGAGTVLGYAARLRHRSGFAALAVTDDERNGVTDRVAATRLLTGPAWAPAFGGFEPYHRLIKELRRVVYPAAIAEFPYDWRLSVTHNATLLADRIDQHLTAWRAHPDHTHARRAHPEQRDAQVVLIAHSMGGLVARALAAVPGAVDDVRMMITLGTPFRGSVKTIEALARGSGMAVPLPTREVQSLARTSPGLHDLLPTYRCHLANGDATVPSAEVIEQLGGDSELASDSFNRQRRLSDVPLPGHELFNGTEQPTLRSFDVHDGELRLLRYGYLRSADDVVRHGDDGRPLLDEQGGDGTVYRYAAALPGTRARSFAQQHGALPRTKTILANIRGLITEADNLDIQLGAGRFGMDAPEVTIQGEPLLIRITGDVDPARLSCAVEDIADADRVIDEPIPTPVRGDTGAQVTVRLPRTGLYRVRVGAGGDPVSKIVLSVSNSNASNGNGDDGRRHD